MDHSQELQQALDLSAEAWEQLPESVKASITAHSEQKVGFSIQDSTPRDSPLVLPPTGIALPEGIVVPDEVQALNVARQQQQFANNLERALREQRPVEPVIIAGAPKPSRTASLSERSRALKNTPNGRNKGRKQRRKESRNLYG